MMATASKSPYLYLLTLYPAIVQQTDAVRDKEVRNLIEGSLRNRTDLIRIMVKIEKFLPEGWTNCLGH